MFVYIIMMRDSK